MFWFISGVIILTYLANKFGRLNKLGAVDQFIMVQNNIQFWSASAIPQGD